MGIPHIHIGLGAKLEALGLIDHIDEHHFRARSPEQRPHREHAADAATDGMTSAAEDTPGDEEHRDAEPQPPHPADPGPGRSRQRATDSVFAVADEIRALDRWLVDLPQRQRTAQIAVWAGRLRRLQDSVGNLAPDELRRVREEMRPLLRDLAGLTKQCGADWVDALSSEWATDDWNAYVAYNEAVAGGHEPDLTREQEETFHRDRLRGLFNPHRRSAKADAHDLLREALEVLPAGDAVVTRVSQRFGRPTERRLEPMQPQPPFRRRKDGPVKPEEPPAVVREVPAEVLAVTRGKRALVAGGQGSREAHRIAIEKSLAFEKLEWVYGERGKGSHFQLLEERMRPGRYDLVLFLASHSGHNSSGLVEACRAAEIPLVYLARGYSVTSVIEAIRQQLLARRVPEWMARG